MSYSRSRKAMSAVFALILAPVIVGVVLHWVTGGEAKPQTVVVVEQPGKAPATPPGRRAQAAKPSPAPAEIRGRNEGPSALQPQAGGKEAVAKAPARGRSASPADGGPPAGANPVVAGAGTEVTDLVVGEPYRAFLLANPAKLKADRSFEVVALEATPASVMILAVGAAAIDSSKSGSLLAAQRVCRLRALAAAAASREVKVQFVERLTQEQATETIKAAAGEKVQGLPVVGQWYSADRSTLYVAFGKVVRP